MTPEASKTSSAAAVGKTVSPLEFSAFKAIILLNAKKSRWALFSRKPGFKQNKNRRKGNADHFKSNGMSKLQKIKEEDSGLDPSFFFAI